MIHKYSIGDWVSAGPDSFGKITSTYLYNGNRVYDIAEKRLPMGDIGLKKWGSLSGILENQLKPITDLKDILLCLVSDRKEELWSVSNRKIRLEQELDALLLTRELL